MIGIGIAVMMTSSLAAQTPRLWAVAVELFREQTGGVVRWEQGLLDATGRYERDWRVDAVEWPVPVPAVLRNRPLVAEGDWAAYNRLARGTTANFQLLAQADGDGFIPWNGTRYGVVKARETAHLAIGEIINLSARGRVAPHGDPLIGGLVVAQRPRKVLVRAVGPALAAYGVSDPSADPTLTLFRDGVPIAANQRWGAGGNEGAVIAAAAAVGAFPLPPGSADAALLLELEPGVYTAHANAADGGSGTVLLEIYTVNPPTTYDWISGEPY